MKEITKFITTLYSNTIAGDAFIELWFWVGVTATVALCAICALNRNKSSSVN